MDYIEIHNYKIESELSYCEQWSINAKGFPSVAMGCIVRARRSLVD